MIQIGVYGVGCLKSARRKVSFLGAGTDGLRGKLVDLMML
jgi:hypothetical protein